MAGRILERIVYYSVMDATIVQLNDDRHLFAANILGIPAALLLIHEIGFWRWKEFNRASLASAS